MLDPRRLAVLTEFAAQGTVPRTAKRLSFSPSAVSQQLAQLQREAGVALFTHEGRRLELTDAGRLLVERGKNVLAEIEAVEAALASHSGLVHGTVRLAAFQTAARFLVAPAVERLSGDHPELEIEILEEEAEIALPRLERGDLDVVVAEEYANAPRPRSPKLRRHDIRQDQMLVALPRGSSPARGTGGSSRGRGNASIPLASLGGADWVTARAGTAYADMAVALCRTARGFEPRIRHRANDL